MDYDANSQDDESDGSISSINEDQLVSNDLTSESQASTLQSTQGIAKNRSFKKIKELEEIFVKEGYDENRNAKISCAKCEKRFNSNRYSRLIKHVKDCPKLDQTDIDVIVAKYDKLYGMSAGINSNNKRRNRKLAAMIMENNLPIHFVESKTFQDFVGDLNSGYKHASRQQLSEMLIPSISDQIRKNFIQQIERIADYSLSIEFDLWTDLVKRSILGVIATDPDGLQYLLDLRNVSIEGHSSESIINALKESLIGVPACKINSMISDSASNCKKARSCLKLDQEYCHLIEHRCLAHLLNNIGCSMANQEPYNDVIESAVRIASLLINDSVFLEKLRKSKTKRVTTATKTRWYSTVSMLESLINVREEAQKHLESGSKRDTDKVSESIGNLKDSLFLQDVMKTVKYMRPLVNCIAVAERQDGSLGETIKAVLDYVSLIFESDWNDEFVVVAASSLLSYFNADKIGEFEFSVMFASYYLDRRYTMNYITRKGSELVLKAVVQIAALSGVSSDSIETILYKEFKAYSQQRGILSKYAHPSQTARDWWRQQSSNARYLKIVGIRLANLKSASANVERLFSVVRYIQGLSRTNYNLETLISLARSKLAMFQNDYDNNILDIMQEIKQSDKIRSTRRKSAPLEASRSSSQPRTRSQSSYSPASCDKLEPGIRKYYNELQALVDFTCVNDPKERLGVASQRRNVDLDLDGILNRFRAEIEDDSDLEAESAPEDTVEIYL